MVIVIDDHKNVNETIPNLIFFLNLETLIIMEKSVILPFAVVLFLGAVVIAEVPSYCNDKSCEGMVQTKLQSFCTEKTGKVMDRCCIFNDTVIGLDWSNCSLTHLENLQMLPKETIMALELL